ncbi:MAG: F0F1 ATP synthase subunit gamma [Burkholderiales bacterium]|nr:MAG: F0F1 ATP synthase subunit gamma [Burkholderiales bacterium]
MTRRRELRDRIASLGEIDEILTAMKNLALVEVRRIEAFIRAQRAAVAVIEDAAADFRADRSRMLGTLPPTRDVLCLVGSERGFCGDFNPRVLEAARRWQGAHQPPAAVLVVGERLHTIWDSGPAHAVPGAGVADEVPAVLQALVASLPTLLAIGEDARATAGMVVIYQAEHAVVTRRLLPLPEPAAQPAKRPYPLTLNLPPARFFAELTDQYLYAAMQHALYESLLEENRRRLNHMEHAVHKLREDLEALAKRRNRLRQEEITEEIEVILLNAVQPGVERIGAEPGAITRDIGPP